MSMNVSAWTTEDLCAWLTENQLEAACSSFRGKASIVVMRNFFRVLLKAHYR